MVMWDYVVKAGSAWFAGFFPLAEIYVAIPFAMSIGLDAVSAALWAALGNITPIILMSLLYDRLTRVAWLRERLERMVSERFAKAVNRYGTGIILLITPWIGVWIVAVTARVMGMRHTRLIAAASLSVTLYAVALAVMLQTGAALLTPTN
ncbi:MAG: small multi-drug export protein [Anaerolineae bacterium]